MTHYCPDHGESDTDSLVCPQCRAEQERDLFRAMINDMPTFKATRALMSAASKVVDVFVHDRVPLTRAQTLAVLQLANATLHLETLLPPVS